MPALLGKPSSDHSTTLSSVLQINYLSFNPFNEWVLATASSDSTVALFDLRKLTAPLHVLSKHEYASLIVSI